MIPLTTIPLSCFHCNKKLKGLTLNPEIREKMIPWYGIPKKLLNNKIEFLIECRSKNETQYLKNCHWKDIFSFIIIKTTFLLKLRKKWTKNLQLFPY
jgi:hypothetical protein